MTPQTTSRIMVLLSMAYGLSVGALAIADSGALSGFTIIGAMVLGFLWFARSLFMKRAR